MQYKNKQNRNKKIKSPSSLKENGGVLSGIHIAGPNGTAIYFPTPEILDKISYKSKHV
ncbi:MAG: hypothetical protein HYT83_03265 [Candidatus Levybacteria bacterium]|nr:hypothetical protein [Candidatus Levybacteria bacterium]